MAHTTTWKVLDMTRDSATGGVTIVRWECRVNDDTHTDCSAVEAGKLVQTYDTSAPDWVDYDDLTEATVLGWVYDSLIEGDETAAEAKARIEADRQAKVTAQVEKKTSVATGTPWAA